MALNYFRIVAAVAVASLGGAISSSALAATMMAATGTPLDYMVHDAGAQPDGNKLVLNTKPGGYKVDYTSDSTIHYNGNGGGFAQVTGVGGDGNNGEGFSDLTIAPESPITGMSAIKFDLFEPSAKDGPTIPSGFTLSDYTFETTVYFVGGGSQTFTKDMGKGNGDNRWIVTADAGESISKITISDLDGIWTKHNQPDFTSDDLFNAIKQVSFNSTNAIPEPATWAMLIVGFAGLGAALRRRRAAVTT
jgi:hypothetical protein